MKLFWIDSRLQHFKLAFCLALGEVIQIVVLWCYFQKPFSWREKNNEKKRFLKEFFFNQWFSNLVWFAVQILEPISRLIDIAARLIDTMAQKFNIFKTLGQKVRTNKRSLACPECGPRMDRNLPVKNRCFKIFYLRFTSVTVRI